MGIGSGSHELESLTVREIEKEDMKMSSSEPSSIAEKGEVVDIVQRETNDSEEELDMLSHEEQFPIDPDAEEEVQQLTFRAVFVGCCLGGVIAASNVYLGSEDRLDLSVLIRSHSPHESSADNDRVSRRFPFRFNFRLCDTEAAQQDVSPHGPEEGISVCRMSLACTGELRTDRQIGPKENVCVQSAATAAGSLGLIFCSGIPAAYQLGLLNTPKEDFGKLCTFTLACAYYGMFFAIPLRKLYILKQKLPFPFRGRRCIHHQVASYRQER